MFWLRSKKIYWKSANIGFPPWTRPALHEWHDEWYLEDLRSRVVPGEGDRMPNLNRYLPVASWGIDPKSIGNPKKNPETRGFPRHVWDLKILCHYVAQVKSPSFRPEACYARVSGHPEIAASPGDMLPKNIDLHEDPWKKSGFGWQKNSQKNRQRNKGKSYFNIIIRHMNFHIPHQQLPSHLY